MSKKRNFSNIKRPYVLVPMCLDFFHHGHVNILKKSSKYGSIILGLITDKGVLSYKKKKPANNFSARKKIAMMIKGVQKIIPIPKLNSYITLTQKYKFEFIVHGDDWKKGPQSSFRKKLIKITKQWNGKVIDIPYTKNISSSIIKKKFKL